MVFFFIPLVSRDECQKELENPRVPLWNSGGFSQRVVYTASGMLETDGLHLSNWGKTILLPWLDWAG